MIKLAPDFDSARAFDGSASAVLPAGGHICRILDARLETARTGSEMLVVAFDVTERGEFDNYYKQKHDRALQYRQDAKWPGVFRAPILTKDGKTSGYFKGLITAIEESNNGYSFRNANCDEKTLNGKVVGFNFGEEEYPNRDGEIRTSVKPFYAVSVETVRNGIEPPPRKPYRASGASQAAHAQGFTEVDDDPDLPF